MDEQNEKKKNLISKEGIITGILGIINCIISGWVSY